MIAAQCSLNFQPDLFCLSSRGRAFKTQASTKSKPENENFIESDPILFHEPTKNDVFFKLNERNVKYVNFINKFTTDILNTSRFALRFFF